MGSVFVDQNTLTQIGGGTTRKWKKDEGKERRGRECIYGELWGGGEEEEEVDLFSIATCGRAKPKHKKHRKTPKLYSCGKVKTENERVEERKRDES